eukprot:6475098-Heterocapsa_arctica.AAC.1
MARAWQEHGKSMARAWQEHGKSMARAWREHGKSMAITWQSHGQYCDDFAMSLPCVCYESPMVQKNKKT